MAAFSWFSGVFVPWRSSAAGSSTKAANWISIRRGMSDSVASTTWNGIVMDGPKSWRRKRGWKLR